MLEKLKSVGKSFQRYRLSRTLMAALSAGPAATSTLTTVAPVAAASAIVLSVTPDADAGHMSYSTPNNGDIIEMGSVPFGTEGSAADTAFINGQNLYSVLFSGSFVSKDFGVANATKVTLDGSITVKGPTFGFVPITANGSIFVTGNFDYQDDDPIQAGIRLFAAGGNIRVEDIGTLRAAMVGNVQPSALISYDNLTSSLTTPGFEIAPSPATGNAIFDFFSGDAGFSGILSGFTPSLGTGEASGGAVPEPSTYALTGIGLLALGAAYRRRQKMLA